MTVAVTLLIGYATFRYFAARHFHQILVDRLTRTGAMADYELAPLISTGDFKKLNVAVRALGKKSGARITVIKNDGKVIADSEKNHEQMENHATRSEIAKALLGETGIAVRHSATMGRNMLYVALPLKESTKFSYIIRVSMFSHDVNLLLSHLTKTMILPVLFLLIVSAGISALIARSVSFPIQKLMTASQAVAKGDFMHKIDITAKNEFGELASYFNEMTEKLARDMTEISSQTDTLNAVLNNISEGIIALNINGKIQLYNKTIFELFDKQISLQQAYWDMPASQDFIELINSVFLSKEKEKKQIEIKGRQFICAGDISDAGEHIIVSVFDITDILEVSKIKRDFVTNASHELKTPLTSINGFLDLAIENCGAETNNYLQVVKRNTQRLINIVNDLLTLAELENKDLRFDRKKINLNLLIKNVVAFLEVKAKEKNLYLKIKLPENQIVMRGDEFKIEQLLVNLIDNAIKYTEKGGVEISTCETDGKVKLTVADTGIGIRENDIARIFERFYVTDKARSRKAGGTGLGLSIVKHIVMLHGGEIAVDSARGSGSKFIVTFEK